MGQWRRWNFGFPVEGPRVLGMEVCCGTLLGRFGLPQQHPAVKQGDEKDPKQV